MSGDSQQYSMYFLSRLVKTLISENFRAVLEMKRRLEPVFEVRDINFNVYYVIIKKN